MKAGFKIMNAISKGHTTVEVRNDPVLNHVFNLGWMFEKTAYTTKDENTVGIWRRKQLKK